jgi:transcription antitermination factor NusG
MKSINKGNIVKFHTPLPDENPNQLYVVLEVIEDEERPRADIQALNTGLSFPPISKVRLGDLEIVEVDTNDLIGHRVTINKSDYSQAEGRVIKVSEQRIEVNLSNGINGVETNVWLTIIDKDGHEHMGTLFVIPE